jgi:hypothetical protein
MNNNPMALRVDHWLNPLIKKEVNMKYINWKVIGIDKDGKEEDITVLISPFLITQLDEEIQSIEDE